ncbi:neuroendocrine convertase 2-like [Mercenaria mercenaria]|uniref:neuroendocrine convertase 2-like n=1 Tax=Mercenaria mercenaria TaxID=6596 RepID=UPI00234EAF05|nr:neuroendocrine convertase 2-like [Mercenaria mercenaria]
MVWVLNKHGQKGLPENGVTIAIMDGGIDIHLLDLERNINTELSYNFVQDNKNVTAEHFNDERPDTLHVTDHGNRVASVLAAVKGNKLCSAGIAYDATIAGMYVTLLY